MEEAAEVVAAATARGLKLIQLVTPTTPPERAQAILRQSTGFVYVVSVAGITGERSELPAELLEQLKWLRTQTTLPLCVGFGVSKAEHVRMLRDHCDGVIVGSAVVRCLETAGPVAEMQAKVSGLARTLRAALDEG